MLSQPTQKLYDQLLDRFGADLVRPTHEEPVVRVPAINAVFWADLFDDADLHLTGMSEIKRVPGGGSQLQVRETVNLHDEQAISEAVSRLIAKLT